MGEPLSFSWSFSERRCGQDISERTVNQTPLVIWAHLWVFFSFLEDRVSGSFQWLQVDKELFWFLAIGWIPGLFISFCTETCEAIECLGESYHFSCVEKVQRDRERK